jgi:hypothetical protein
VQKTAELIRTSIAWAHWPVEPVNTRFDDATMVDFVFPGISVARNCFWDGKEESMALVESCKKSHTELTKALSDSGLPDVHGSPPDPSTPFNTIVIRVGLRSVAGEIPGNLFISPEAPIVIAPKSKQNTKP